MLYKINYLRNCFIEMSIKKPSDSAMKTNGSKKEENYQASKIYFVDYPFYGFI